MRWWERGGVKKALLVCVLLVKFVFVSGCPTAQVDKVGTKCTLVVCVSVCEVYSLAMRVIILFSFWVERIFGLLVTAFVKMSTRTIIVVPRIPTSPSACAPLMMHLQTERNPTTRINEVRRANGQYRVPFFFDKKNDGCNHELEVYHRVFGSVTASVTQ